MYYSEVAGSSDFINYDYYNRFNEGMRCGSSLSLGIKLYRGILFYLIYLYKFNKRYLEMSNGSFNTHGVVAGGAGYSKQEVVETITAR